MCLKCGGGCGLRVCLSFWRNVGGEGGMSGRDTCERREGEVPGCGWA